MELSESLSQLLGECQSDVIFVDKEPRMKYIFSTES